MIKKQVVIISVCAAVFAVLIAVFFLVLKPMIDKRNEKVTTKLELLENGNSVLKNNKGEILLTLLAGEELGINNRILITTKIERAAVKNVQVKNTEDTYKLIHHLGQDYYFVEGAPYVPVHGEIIASFFTNVGYLLSMERVAAKDVDDGNEILENPGQFGFSQGFTENNYFVVTTVDDIWYKIIIGDKIPTRGGYYVMYEDKDGVRPAIYILDTMMEDTILSTRYSIMMPIVAMTLKQNEIMFADNFNFYKGNDLMVNIYQAPIPEGSDALLNNVMGYPAPYMVSFNHGNLLYFFASFVGERVVYAYDILEEEISDEIWTEYGFDESVARISFEVDGREFYYIFSKQNEAGNYYVLSEFGSIVEIAREKLILEGERRTFLEWDELKFVDRSIYSENINDIVSIEMKALGEIDDVFTVVRPDKTQRDLIVTTKDGTNITVDGVFRSLYYTMLSVELQDYYEGDKEVYKDKEPLLEYVITTSDGVVRDYKFYFVDSNTRRCFVTLNGDGDFYVSRDRVLKLIEDIKLVLQNIPIDRDAVE